MQEKLTNAAGFYLKRYIWDILTNILFVYLIRFAESLIQHTSLSSIHLLISDEIELTHQVLYTRIVKMYL